MKKGNILAAVLAACIFASVISNSDNCPGDISSIKTVYAETITVGKPAITALDNMYKGVSVTFSSAANAEGYYIYRRSKSSDPWTLIAVNGADEFSCLDKDASKEGGLYTYMVCGYNGDILSEESDAKTITRFNITKAKISVTYGQKGARNMYTMINDFRTGSEAWTWDSTNTSKNYVSGLGKLAYDYNLEKIAMIRAAEIAVKFGHERPNGKVCFTALDDAGYVYSTAGENVAYGYKNAKTAFAAFQETNNYYSGQGHRRNMLSADYNVCAIGHVKANGVHYWVQLFAYTQDDSDYTKTKNNKTEVIVDIASEDISTYEKALTNLSATYKDYLPSQTKIITTDSGKRFATLTYEKSTGAQGYEVYRSSDKKSGYELIKRVKGQDKLAFTDKKLTRNKKYYYYIVPYRLAHDDYIYGKKSKVVMIKTQ